MQVRVLPYRKIDHIVKLGNIIRQKRKHQNLTQAQLADLSEVGNRFISDLENGKPTLEIAKILQVLGALGLELHLYLKESAPLEDALL